MHAPSNTPARRIGAAALMLFAAIAAIVFLAVTGGGPSSASAESSVASYAALDGDKPSPATAADVRPALDRIARNEPEVLTPAAKLIASVPTGKVILYRSAGGGICLALATYAGSAQTSCKPASKANVSGVTFGGPVNRFGIVPDGVDTVQFVLRSGKEQTVKVVDNFYVAPDEATKGIFALDGVQQTQEFVPRSDVPAIGESVTDSRGATTRVEPDGTVSLAGPGVKLPAK